MFRAKGITAFRAGRMLDPRLKAATIALRTNSLKPTAKVLETPEITQLRKQLRLLTDPALLQAWFKADSRMRDQPSNLQIRAAREAHVDEMDRRGGYERVTVAPGVAE